MTTGDIKPIALALPRKDEPIVKGRYGSMMPVTPANGFTIIAQVKPGAPRRFGRLYVRRRVGG